MLFTNTEIPIHNITSLSTDGVLGIIHLFLGWIKTYCTAVEIAALLTPNYTHGRYILNE